MEDDYSNLIDQSRSLDDIDEWLFGPKSPKAPSPATDPSSTSKSPSVTVFGTESHARSLVGSIKKFARHLRRRREHTR
ncbi:hypothetical protein PTTG_29041 [Puccinia triticina 1-1 BBBD Race 1]|uniref:Uncharacterized protein n=1 Tax=Puccinia triticina (isolate 1-1 / race 1 (BBBD)) TaxID=630390 RepID=A0A180G918_PUCT1|nr:hypothetical protein PTTG_29041 [Puccinia triticina 1-1 BBBD Race 1]